MDNSTRHLTAADIAALSSRGCSAEDWNDILVTDSFSSDGITDCRFSGKVVLEGRAELHRIGTLRNCLLGDGSSVCDAAFVGADGESNFGHGVEAAVINEAGGREIPIYPALTAQTAYLLATGRHRSQTIDALKEMIRREHTAPVAGHMAAVGPGASLLGCGIIRNVLVGPDAKLEGAAFLENGTVASRPGQETYIGPGVRMRDFIVCGNSRIDNATQAERCFFGNGTRASALTAVDSVFFAGSHCDNGEVCNVFAGPYTASHHKSSLLIAGMFSFFNAGSGTNQSNHLLKSGPVHQGIHRRGCKYGSDAYMMLPALDGAFTTIIGRHKNHPDTDDFPFSILIESGEQSWLLPGANLATCGAARDIAKWPARDRRDAFSQDIINFDECSPFIAERMERALAACGKLLADTPDRETIYQRMHIKTAMLRRGEKLYRLALDKYVGAMLETGATPDTEFAAGPWIDAAGEYMPAGAFEAIMNNIDSGAIAGTAALTEAFRDAHDRYAAHAAGWAVQYLHRSIGRTPSRNDMDEAVRRGREARKQLDAMAAKDLRAEQDEAMSVGYGIDTHDSRDREADFRNVRGL